MGKCVFTGKETNNKMLLFNKNLYVCDDVKSIIQKTIVDPNSYVRVESFQKLLTLSENVDEKYKDTIDKFLIMLQQSNIEEHPVENDDINIDFFNDEKNESEKEKKTIIKSKGTFEPPLGKYFLRMLGIGLGSILTFGLLAPWFIILEEKWECQYLTIDGNPVHFDAPVGQYYLKCIVWALLTIITFGIYGIFVPVYSRRWMNEYLFIDKEDEKVTE